ncbi:prolow-density lipoprotein receptor-related protein 1-like isoform X1 [Biomphalaria glabrata]|uniref:Prolow-density lipoprotein receptor-related protein 1-like isoform X1 n=1 Tax=Biomphalaria glabrata TaxID=6526 RepID=A0A9W3AIN7_BIOGL|nr:prolow-density lipoprotein receptor-related protein 1-like isoform X1 [Biomphalaria glabrata]
MVANQDGKYPSVLHYSDTAHPEAIVVQSQLRYLFWIETFKDTYQIQRSNLDGKNKITLINKSRLMHNPEHLAIDIWKNRLCWTNGNQICCFTFDGEVLDRCFDVQNSVQSLDIMHGLMIMTETLGGLKVSEFNNYIPSGPMTSPTFYSGINFTDVIYYHVSKQTLASDPCMKDLASTRNDSEIKGQANFDRHCSHLCLPSYESSKCVCMTGYWLKSNGECWEGVVENNFWLFSDLQTGQMFRQFALLPDYYTVLTPGRFHFIDVTIDSIEKRMYWVDANSNIVYSQLLNGTQLRVIFIGNETFHIAKIKMAARPHLLYIISKAGEVLVFSLLSGYYRRILQEVKWMIRHIDVDEENRLLYMTAILNTATDKTSVILGAILCSCMDGSEAKTVYVYNGSPLGIVLYNNSLFWVDPIEHMILMGKNVGKVVQVQPVVRLTGDAYPENIVVKGEEVFFTDKTKQALQRFHLNSSAMISNAGYPYMNRIAGLSFYDSSIVLKPDKPTHCNGIWVPKPNSQTVCVCDDEPKNVTDGQCFHVNSVIQKVAASLGMCMVKPQPNASVIGENVGNYVTHGNVLTVSCNPGFIFSKTNNQNETRVCSQGQWSSRDSCVSVMKFTITGNSSHGYVALKESTLFIVPQGIFYVDVVCIGGGGGGIDACNKSSFQNDSQAGDGGLSSFGSYLRANGGHGGSLDKGGKGGVGKTLFGGDGLLSYNCQGGGAAGQTEPADVCKLSQTSCLFCGAGGAMIKCSNCFSRRGGCGGVGSQKGPEEGAADNYGGGATGLFGGGSGGGGGYSRGLIKVFPQQQIHIKVGLGGTPSARAAGDGIVVVGWGSRLEKLIDKAWKKSTGPCKSIIYKSYISFDKCNT